MYLDQSLVEISHIWKESTIKGDPNWLDDHCPKADSILTIYLYHQPIFNAREHIRLQQNPSMCICFCLKQLFLGILIPILLLHIYFHCFFPGLFSSSYSSVPEYFPSGGWSHVKSVSKSFPSWLFGVWPPSKHLLSFSDTSFEIWKYISFRNYSLSYFP